MPRNRSTAYMPPPAIANRTAASHSGGQCATAMRIARYVDPQTM
jgi:hypothetical protein